MATKNQVNEQAGQVWVMIWPDSVPDTFVRQFLTKKGKCVLFVPRLEMVVTRVQGSQPGAVTVVLDCAENNASKFTTTSQCHVYTKNIKFNKCIIDISYKNVVFLCKVIFSELCNINQLNQRHDVKG